MTTSAPVRRRLSRTVTGAVVLVAVSLLVLPLAACAASSSPVPRADPPPASPRWWPSGAFLATNTTAAGAAAMGRWRARPLAGVTVYSGRAGWSSMATDAGALDALGGFPGTIYEAVPLVPDGDDGRGLAEVARGERDGVFAGLADELVRQGRGNAVVRVGFEANATWFAWGADAASADTWRTAARRAITAMKSRAPGLVVDFDITCAGGLSGSTDRLAPLTRLYPGDDLVDVVGCDHYDGYDTAVGVTGGWERALHAQDGPGLADVVAFARAHGKRFSVPEWGTSHGEQGGGDDPEFVRRMYRFFADNADVLAFEAYFDEPDRSIASSLWGGPRGSLNPRAAAEYVHLWGTPVP